MEKRMPNELNVTHDPARKSFVESANKPNADFPIQNLPFGVYKRPGTQHRVGVATGDQIVDLLALVDAGLLQGDAQKAALATTNGGLNDLMSLRNPHSSALRSRLSDLLEISSSHREATGRALVPISQAQMQLPAKIGNFTDFMASSFHALRHRPGAVLSKTFQSLPVAYHSRASTVRVQQAIRRPNVQRQIADIVEFGPSHEMDYELELGIFIGVGNQLGAPVPIDDARDYIFGFCLLNDWSIRDVQRWESVPLGPFLAKSTLTTISPWVVTEEAMRPFKIAAFKRDPIESSPLPYLFSQTNESAGGYNIELEAAIRTETMRRASVPFHTLTRTNFRHMYWTVAQMLTHHMSNGCSLLPGDLLGSGTISGPEDESAACLMELNARGARPIPLPNGETRLWLADGDEIRITGRAVANGYASIGFGESQARVEPAVQWQERIEAAAE
jgi:fumarylacetoacetase